MWWLNPVYHTYRKLGEVDPQSLMDQMFKDDDDDGVPNYLDREPNTKKGCPVDAHGVALDSDHDGIIDCLDKEPFSPPGYRLTQTVWLLYLQTHVATPPAMPMVAGVEETEPTLTVLMGLTAPTGNIQIVLSMVDFQERIRERAATRVTTALKLSCLL